MLVTDKSLGQDWPMCPKHGVAHGVCVEPIKAPLFCSSCGYTPHGCDPCRERLLEDKPPNTIYLRDPYEMQDAVPPPNRFDPYEALDRIGCAVKREEWYTQPVNADLHALRAYITGMEQ